MMKILYWALGLIVVIIVAVYLMSYVAQVNFDQNVKEDVNKILADVDIKEVEKVKEADLDNLPESVASWLRFSQVVGKDKIKTVRLKQIGLMKTKPEQSGMETTAEQYFNTQDPAFIWKTRVNMMPGLYFAGEDKYYDGKGKMLIKVLSLFPVVDATGSEMDQGTLTRYLGEIVWFPTAALSEYIKWEAIDKNTAKATMNYKGTEASAVFNFTDSGKVKSFQCKRYYSGQDGYSLENYYAPVWDYKEFAGIKIPTKAKAIWRLDSGDFEYYDMEITDVEYNISEMY